MALTTEKVEERPVKDPALECVVQQSNLVLYDGRQKASSVETGQSTSPAWPARTNGNVHSSESVCPVRQPARSVEEASQRACLFKRLQARESGEEEVIEGDVDERSATQQGTRGVQEETLTGGGAKFDGEGGIVERVCQVCQQAEVRRGERREEEEQLEEERN